MPHGDTFEQARYIYTTGKLIHDHLLKVQSAYLASIGSVAADLSIAQLHAIMKIRVRDQVFMTELSELLGVSPPSASAMVDRLVEKGILVRQHSRKDRRKVHVRISPEAGVFIHQLEEILLGTFVDLVKKLGPGTTRQWCEVLGRVQKILEKETMP